MVVLLLIVAAAMPALGNDGKAKAPVGVWSGPGDRPAAEDETDEYVIIAIADGPEGSQTAFYMETVVGGPCEMGPAYLYGTAAVSGSIEITGSLVCENGAVHSEAIVFTFDQNGDDLESATSETTGPFLKACGDGVVTIEGTPGDDKPLVGTAGNDIIDGGGGNDTILGKDGYDILCGGPGNNKLKGGRHIDVMIGGPGNDKIIGGAGTDFGLGGDGKDTMKGGGDADMMHGEAKNDTILGGGGGGDVADGGAGTDTCDAETEYDCELDPVMRVKSSAFRNGDPIPEIYTCDDDDISPPLKIINLPSAAETLAIIVEDPDAPGGIWDHWVVYDIEARAKIPEDTNLGTDGRNSWGDLGYGGPCPPSGTHRYFFDVYALDTTLDLAPGATKQQVLNAMEGHILAEATLMGRYSA
jgi:Raf kinase inhibitor-like YbhB/YbcL family protein